MSCNTFREEAHELAGLTKEEQRGHVARLQAIADNKRSPARERTAARHRAAALAKLLGLNVQEEPVNPCAPRL